MAELDTAVVIGGFSESEDFMWGLTNAVSNSGIASRVEGLTYAQAKRRPDILTEDPSRIIAITHSIGAEAVEEAGIFCALNGVEPTQVPHTIARAFKVFTNRKVGRDAEHTIKTGLLDGPKEVLRNISTLGALTTTRKFSTVQKMIDGGTVLFPAGRIYLPTDKDEFKFGSGDEVERAAEDGIVAYMLDGYHNTPLFHPVEAVETIRTIIEDDLFVY